jgi:hypothetical protein
MRELLSLDDDALLDWVEKNAFGYFLEHANPANGLVRDSSVVGDPCSIAAVGFALSCYPIGVERGWMTRADAARVTKTTLDFFLKSPRGPTPDATEFNGFYYHFLEMETGRRTWQCEVSVIDTTLLLAGVMLAATYFDGDAPIESAIRAAADVFYRRIDWRWACGGGPTLRQGWNPESGFIHYGWEGYDEAAILYVLGLGSPTHPLDADAYLAWTSTYQWESIYDYEHLYAGPLFIHQFSHAWLDFNGIRDCFMREKDSDYFENTRRASLMQREYARRNPHDFVGYDEDCWGVSACKGYGFVQLEIGGRRRSLLGYSARGAPFGPDDGTLTPTASLASLPFTPKESLRALRRFCERYPEIFRDGRLTSGFNPTIPGEGPAGWVYDGSLGLDQGLVVMMIENYRSGFVWRLMKKCPYVAEGLRRVGFEGGWLA